MESICTLDTFNTQLCADCVAWCPIKGKEHILVCTTYQLTSQGNKTGSLLLYEMAECGVLKCLQVVANLPGILDAKWKPQTTSDGKVVFATVDSSGDVTIFNLVSAGVLKLVRAYTFQTFSDLSPSPLALYIDFSTHNETTLIVSSSNGQLTLLDFNDGSMKCCQQWESHAFEAWVATFDENNPNIIYSGGDDSLMKCWDIRTNPAKSVWKSTAHSAGVTSFMTSSKRPQQFSSGSYDEYLKLWDTRMLKPQNPLADVCLDGGVWRLKAYVDKSISVVAACMYSGFKVLEWNESTFSVISSYRQNENCLAYGVDWNYLNSIFAACSFYDHKLTICKYLK